MRSQRDEVASPATSGVSAPALSPGARSAEELLPSASLADAREVELVRLRRELVDLQIALQNSNEHGDLLQEHFYRLSASLQAEVLERQASEQKLQKLIHAARQERADLEILVQILIDQGDESAEDGEKARVDALTRIANRRRFDETILHEWGAHLRLNRPLAVVLCDVDHFKLYNDYYGHLAGDQCLIKIASAIGDCLREQDLVARYGGEEFAIILPGSNLRTAVRVAERVRGAVKAATVCHAASPTADHVTLSIGVASKIPAEQGETDGRLLIDQADQCLYLAKHRGRDRVAHL